MSLLRTTCDVKEIAVIVWLSKNFLAKLFCRFFKNELVDICSWDLAVTSTISDIFWFLCPSHQHPGR
ncbi:hypothetical protein CYMTET_25351 [Cymbomonas tetramitiformis]|uniref:Uncharacterized protein n=1 Tax=Cymbomonas tetramitiformis TaxID=36881 RepID=A0AAE0FVI8_9CHLO|nr:hypothetical protein CYMTET_25351 [Cymbomonas tetramitiformis]